MSGEPKTLTLEEFLIRDNAAMRRAGTDLAEAALHVIREYDGTHRLALAAAAWMQTIADEGGRGEMHGSVPVVARDEAALTYRGQPVSVAEAQAILDVFPQVVDNTREIEAQIFELRNSLRRLAGGESEK